MSAARVPGKAAGPPRTARARARATAPRPAQANLAVENAAAREAAASLHNMSAPPRATITFRVLAGSHAAEGEDRAAASGLRWVCRIDLLGVFRPVPEGMPRDPMDEIMCLQTLELERCLLAHALAEERGSNEPDAALRREVAALPARGAARRAAGSRRPRRPDRARPAALGPAAAGPPDVAPQPHGRHAGGAGGAGAASRRRLPRQRRSAVTILAVRAA